MRSLLTTQIKKFKILWKHKIIIKNCIPLLEVDGCELYILVLLVFLCDGVDVCWATVLIRSESLNLNRLWLGIFKLHEYTNGHGTASNANQNLTEPTTLRGLIFCSEKWTDKMVKWESMSMLRVSLVTTVPDATFLLRWKVFSKRQKNSIQLNWIHCELVSFIWC